MTDFHAYFDRYLDGTLSETERHNFETSLEADPSLARDFALYQQARESLIRQFGEEVDTKDIHQLIAEGERAYLANRLRMRIAMWVVVLGVVAAGVLLSWQPWKNTKGPIQGTAENPCFDYDFTEGPLDTSVWQVIEPSRDVSYNVQNGYLRLEAGARGGSVALRLRGYRFEGDLAGIVEIGSVDMGNGYGRNGRVDFMVTGDDLWEVPEFMFRGARNRLGYYTSDKDLVRDLTVPEFTPRHFYRFERIADTFILAHANQREGPFAEMNRRIVPGFFKVFQSFELSISARDSLGPIHLEVGRVTIFKGCVRD
ncbi:MAG: hypothetical protein R3330_10150 [Saprospiraceae bacterium]|nr:hypothetical protein [Saprospiraceae bacterium]